MVNLAGLHPIKFDTYLIAKYLKVAFEKKEKFKYTVNQKGIYLSGKLFGISDNINNINADILREMLRTRHFIAYGLLQRPNYGQLSDVRLKPHKESTQRVQISTKHLVFHFLIRNHNDRLFLCRAWHPQSI